MAPLAACLLFMLPRIARGQTYAYVATAYADTVTVLDTRTNSVAKVIAGDGYPLAGGKDRDDSRLKRLSGKRLGSLQEQPFYAVIDGAMYGL